MVRTYSEDGGNVPCTKITFSQPEVKGRRRLKWLDSVLKIVQT
jgi:hypothetical protein